MERLGRLGERGHHARRNDGAKRPPQYRLHLGSRPCLGRGRKRGIHRRALGRSRGGFTSKVHCLSDGRGRPIAFHLTPGEAADCKAYDDLIDLPERHPKALLADKASDSDAIRADLKRRRIKAEVQSQDRDPLQQAPLQGTQLDRACLRTPQNQPRRRHMIRSACRDIPWNVVLGFNSLLAQICPRRLRNARRQPPRA
jgi:transposase